MERLALGLDQILRAQPLVAILTAAQVEQVVGIRVQRLAEPAGRQLEADPAPRAASLEHEQVAAVGVDVHQVRVERADAQDATHGRGRAQRRGVGRDVGGFRHAASPPCCQHARRLARSSERARVASPAREPSRSSSDALRRASSTTLRSLSGSPARCPSLGSPAPDGTIRRSRSITMRGGSTRTLVARLT